MSEELCFGWTVSGRGAAERWREDRGINELLRFLHEAGEEHAGSDARPRASAHGGEAE